MIKTKLKDFVFLLLLYFFIFYIIIFLTYLIYLTYLLYLTCFTYLIYLTFLTFLIFLTSLTLLTFLIWSSRHFGYLCQSGLVIWYSWISSSLLRRSRLNEKSHDNMIHVYLIYRIKADLDLFLFSLQVL